MKTKVSLLLCFLMLGLASACSDGDTVPTPSADAGEASISEAESAASPQSARKNLLEEAQGPVPDFLDAEQQTLYKKAKTAYMEFTFHNGGFGSESSGDPAFETDGMQYYKCNGSITSWTDFEDSMLSVFTPEYFEELNNLSSYTDGDGVFHERTVFVERDGDLYYSGGARGSDITFVEPEAFALVSESDTEIRFDVIGTYDDFAYDEDGNVIQKENGDFERAGSLTQEKYALVMRSGPDGWRFSQFQIAY